MTRAHRGPHQGLLIAAVALLAVAAVIAGFLFFTGDSTRTGERRPKPVEKDPRIRGVVYDIGDPKRFDAALVRRELRIIANDLHANAVRITGSDRQDLEVATREALAQGLQVWLAPMYPGRDERATTAALVEVATDAERLRRRHPGIVLVVGVEMSLSMKGILRYEGDLFEFMETPAFEKAITSGEVSRRLDAALGRITKAVRPVFKGRLSYASTLFEQIDWRRFDVVGADLYREKKTKAMFPAMVRNYLSHGKPVVAMEFGSTTYKGSDAVPFDNAVDDLEKPTRVVGGLVRDERVQARELTELIALFDKAGLQGGFVFTFKEPSMPHDPDVPERDLDMASFSLVKTYASKNRDERRTFRDVPWEPKRSFWAVAEAYESR